ncbi:hypothetical protein Tco_1538474 [Tanacetum coccineum]
MSTLNQQTLADSGASERPPMLEKGSYISWASRFMRFLENKQEDGERMRRSIKVGPYVRQLIPDPDKPDQPNATIIEPVSKMSEINKKQYYADIRVKNYLLQGIPNDIYNSHIHLRLVDEFDKFVSTEGESLSFVYERLTTLVNVMDRNQIRPQKITINTKFLNSLQPGWSKYVTVTRQNANVKTAYYDQLFDTLTLEAHSNVHNSQSHATPSYSHSPQPYYVTHPTSVIDHEKDYQGEIQGDA